MDEDKKETTAASKEEGVSGADEAKQEDDDAAPPPPASAGGEPDEAPAKEDSKTSSGKVETKAVNADDKESAVNGGDGDGTKAEADETPTAPDEEGADTKKGVATVGGKSSRKKRAPSPETPPAASSSSAAAAAAAAPESSGGGREKRARKTLVAYAPEDFTKVDRSVQIHPGRGVKVGSIKAVRASIEGSKDHALAELAHKLLFGGNKKPAKDSVKSNILEFSGYLPPKPKDVTEKELEAMDKKIEAKMGEKAFNLKVTEIRDLCDFFALERTKINAKAELIDCLLDFLSEPSDEYVKGSKSAKASSSSAASKRKGGSRNNKKGDSSEESDEDDEAREVVSKSKKRKGKDVDLLQVEKGEVPTDDALRAWVKCFVQCYDLERASIKVVLQVAGEKFGVDLADKKELLKDMLADAMG